MIGVVLKQKAREEEVHVEPIHLKLVRERADPYSGLYFKKISCNIINELTTNKKDKTFHSGQNFT